MIPAYRRLPVLLVAVVLGGCATTSGPREPVPAQSRARRVYDVLMERRTGVPTVRSVRQAVETVPGTLRRCPGVTGTAMVYAMGSSTMGALLGPALERMLKKSDVRFRKWGKASSGLARPDFHDWPSKVPGLVQQYSPDIWVVSLGTNDFQPVRTRRGGWIRLHTKRWALTYAARVDRMLRLMSPQRRRTVIWIGPTSFPGENAQKVGPLINRIIRERVEAFGGPAYYLDAWAATSNARGKPAKTLRVPGRRKPIEVRGHDGIHLTAVAVRALLARPAADRVEACLTGALANGR